MISTFHRPAPTDSATPLRLCAKLRRVVSDSRDRLIARYELMAPTHRALIRSAVAFAEIEAWDTPFPHLLFPDLAEARLAAVLPRSSSFAFQAA